MRVVRNQGVADSLTPFGNVQPEPGLESLMRQVGNQIWSYAAEIDLRVGFPCALQHGSIHCRLVCGDAGRKWGWALWRISGILEGKRHSGIVLLQLFHVLPLQLTTLGIGGKTQLSPDQVKL